MDHYEKAQIVYWVPDRSLAVFFDKQGDTSFANAIVLGTITSDLTVLTAFPPWWK
ncbi:hypothetical protein [Breoghania sp.]|uniref:cyclophilin-like fold protein n=1 Tax=Breoghania sp. TaxID=2065378 RepID=UPI00262430AB|nr:hypothetical protein [Breoghania sp.]MDJ0932807.1 hypothetical protein [Breoghania sp.]